MENIKIMIVILAEAIGCPKIPGNLFINSFSRIPGRVLPKKSSPKISAEILKEKSIKNNNKIP